MHPNPETIFSQPNLLWPTTFDVLNSTPHLGRESDIILFFPTLSCARRQPPQVKGRNLERSQSLRLTHSGCIMYITSWFFKQIVLHQERICSISNLYYAPDNDCRFTVFTLAVQCAASQQTETAVSCCLKPLPGFSSSSRVTTILSKYSLHFFYSS